MQTSEIILDAGTTLDGARWKIAKPYERPREETCIRCFCTDRETVGRYDFSVSSVGGPGVTYALCGDHAIQQSAFMRSKGGAV